MIGMLVMTARPFFPPTSKACCTGRVRLSGIVMGVMSVAWTFGSIVGGRVMTWSTLPRLRSVGRRTADRRCGDADRARSRRAARCGRRSARRFSAPASARRTRAFSSRRRRASAGNSAAPRPAANLFSRQVGQAVGTAVFGAVFNLGVFGHAHPANESRLDVRSLDWRKRSRLALHHIFQIGACSRSRSSSSHSRCRRGLSAAQREGRVAGTPALCTASCGERALAQRRNRQTYALRAHSIHRLFHKLARCHECTQEALFEPPIRPCIPGIHIGDLR